MPPRTITIVLNVNQTKRSTLVLRSLDASPGEVILREARNKFRVKGLCHVFLQGGGLLQSDADLGKMPWVTEVWVGKGESYAGPPAIKSHSGGSGEVRIIANKSFIDDKAIKQLQFVGGLPGVKVAVGMPDLHPGNRYDGLYICQ